MSEEQVIQVTTKNPKKVEQGKKLAEYNRKKREELKKGVDSNPEKSEQVSNYYSAQSYGIGALIIVGVVGCTVYYVYNKKTKGDSTQKVQKSQLPIPKKQIPNKFEME